MTIGKKRLDGISCHAFICTRLDELKKVNILDSSDVCVKGICFFVIEDQTTYVKG